MFPSDKFQNEEKVFSYKTYFAKQSSVGNYVGQKASNNMTI